MLPAEHSPSNPLDVPALGDLYFAYGGDMDAALMHERGCHAPAVGIACLSHFRLGFFGHSWTWDGGYETVVEDDASDVWGVLYRPSLADWDHLDAWMGARMDGSGMYFHFPTVVTTPQGIRHHIRLYKKDILGRPTQPSDAYLRLLMRGAEQQGLPRVYLDRLRALDARPADPSVPRAGNPRRGKLVEIDCRHCGHGATESP